eukprot:8786868-Lingulodinium_polyedra.AAC.1
MVPQRRTPNSTKASINELLGNSFLHSAAHPISGASRNGGVCQVRRVAEQARGVARPAGGETVALELQ